jgi:hypothetical protein
VVDSTDCFDTRKPHPLPASRVHKIAQLIGAFDREGWNGTGTPRLALHRTESRFVYFLFGDNWRMGHGKPNNNLELTFLPRPPLVPGILRDSSGRLQRAARRGQLERQHVRFLQHRLPARGNLRTDEARSDNDGADFTPLHEVSRYKFINFSTQIVTPGSTPPPETVHSV